MSQIQKVRAAIGRMEEAAQRLIAQAEVVSINTTGWERRSHRSELLDFARAYAAAVNTVTRVRK